jgi:hypothetical protein
MYPECRHVKPSGELCTSPALHGSHWCYFHKRLHERQTARQAAQAEAFGRPRTLDGRFLKTLDHGDVPAGAATSACHPDPEWNEGKGPAVLPHPWENASLDLPPLEAAASIQLALIEVAQALAANCIDPKRAGLLLYALQVASTNVKHLDLPSRGVRAITYTSDGTPLAPQEYGWDLEDIEEEIDREDQEEEEEEEA